MTNQRFNQLFVAARAAKQSLDAKGFLQRNRLPKITLTEHHELINKHPKMAAFTRIFDYPADEYIEDTNRPAPAQLPKLTEVWVGARSLGCIPGESAETESEGLSASQMDQEDAAELTDLQTLLYHDARTGQPLIEDEETGIPRPIRCGDVVTIVRGSNDDLDAVFLEEGDDPRVQNDATAEGTDHRWSGRFRANSDLENKFHHDPEYKLPNSAAPEGVRWQPDDFTMRRLAQKLAAKIIERRPEWANNLLALTDEAEQRLRSVADDLAFNSEGQLVKGYFMTKQEFFGSIEANMAELDRERSVKITRKFPSEAKPRTFKRTKQPPQAVDWNKVRTPAQRKRREALTA